MSLSISGMTRYPASNQVNSPSRHQPTSRLMSTETRFGASNYIENPHKDYFRTVQTVLTRLIDRDTAEMRTDQILQAFQKEKIKLEPDEIGFIRALPPLKKSTPKASNAAYFSAISSAFQSANPQKPDDLRNWLRILMDHFTQTDELTGLQQRPMLYTSLQAALDEAKRTKGIFSVLMMDLDRFKHVNDKYGHPVGDVVLKSFAKKIQCIMNRDSDGAFRLGGEEFVVVLPGAGSQVAESFARKLQSELLEITKSHHSVRRNDNPEWDQMIQERDISASIGIITINPNKQTQVMLRDPHKQTACVETLPLDSTSLLKKVDQVLYEAKQDRNGFVHVTLASDGTESRSAEWGPSARMPVDSTPGSVFMSTLPNPFKKVST